MSKRLPMPVLRSDRRSVRSRAAIVAAFNTLLVTEERSDITIAEVTALADVGRSTFYAHFANLEALIAASLAPLFESLASACLDGSDSDSVERVLRHLWEKRKLVRTLMTERRHAGLVRVLSDACIAAQGRTSAVPLASAGRLEIAGLFWASGTLAVLKEWLCGRTALSASEVGRLLEQAMPAAG